MVSVWFHCKLARRIRTPAPVAQHAAAYLGTQGDPWDAQMDMALAAAGSIVAIGIAAARGALPRELGR
jgi:uncharacterized membrane protein YjdF